MDSTLHNIMEMDSVEFASSTTCDSENIVKLFNVKKNDFTLITQNIRSIYQNFDDFMVSTSQLNIDPTVIVLTECWLRDYKPIPSIPNYNMFSSTKYKNKSDGVVVYVGVHVTANVREIFLLDASCLLLQIEEKTILAIYRSPSIADTSGFVNSLSNYLERFTTCSSIVVVGDININLIPRENEQSSERRNRSNYLEMLAVQNIMPGHCLPTRESNSLDHIMIKIDKTKMSAQISVLNTSVTDHLILPQCVCLEAHLYSACGHPNP